MWLCVSYGLRSVIPLQLIGSEAFSSQGRLKRFELYENGRRQIEGKEGRRFRQGWQWSTTEPCKRRTKSIAIEMNIFRGNRLSPSRFRKVFARWVPHLNDRTQGEALSISSGVLASL